MTARPFRMVRTATVVALGINATSCAVGPNFHRPVAPVATGYVQAPLQPPVAGPGVAGGPQHFDTGADIQADWWTLFRSPALNAMIAHALRANSDLAAARAALKVAHETYLAQRGSLFPTVDAGVTTTRARSSQYLSPVLNQPIFAYSLQTAQVNVGYTLDFFGGIRRQTESVRAQEEAQRFQTEAVYLTLTSNVVAAAVQEASLREQVAVQQRIIALTETITAVFRRQLAAGQIAWTDLRVQETALAQARAALPPLQKALTQQQDLLAYLTGQTPAAAKLEPIDLATLTLPAALPVSLPSALIRQRPDVRAAEANLHAASALIGVAIANRLPSLTLSASAGGSASAFSTLLANSNYFWSVGAGLAQPIFQGGTLRHRERGARAAYEQADAQYRSAVLAAFQNVADTLHALEVDGAAVEASRAAQHSAAATLTIVEYQLRQGQVQTLTVLNAEQAVRQADAVLVQAEAARFADTAALFEAFGGGWWHQPGVAAGTDGEPATRVTANP